MELNSKIEEYQPNPEIINQIKKHINPNDSFLVFAGEWCSDTKVLLPQFEKVMQAISFDRKKITYYFLDRKKTSPQGKEKEYKIEYIPVFILLRDGKEIGRITEVVEKSMEQDLLKIFETKN